MLYLIEDGNYLKIGFTKDIKSRMKTYQTHNPTCVLLQTKKGIKKDEATLHSLCESYRFNNEWYYNVVEVKQTFENYISIIDNEWQFMKNILDNFIKYITSHMLSDDCYKHMQYMLVKTDINYKIRDRMSDFMRSLHKTEHDRPADYNKYSRIYHIMTTSSDKWDDKLRWEIINFLYEYNYIDNEQLNIIYSKLINMLTHEELELEEQNEYCIQEAQQCLDRAMKFKETLNDSFQKYREDYKNKYDKLIKTIKN